MRSLADTGSKFEGTGFEKEQIGQIQVPVLIGATSAVGRRNGLSVRDAGDAVALLEGEPLLTPAKLRFCTDDRLDGFGTNVIFAEDFRKPAWMMVSTIIYLSVNVRHT